MQSFFTCLLDSILRGFWKVWLRWTISFKINYVTGTFASVSAYIYIYITFFRQCHLPTVETPILINYKLTLLKLFITGYTDTQYLDSR